MKTQHVSGFWRWVPPVPVLAGAPAAGRRWGGLVSDVLRRPVNNHAAKTEAGPFDAMIDDLVAMTRRDAPRFGPGTRERRGDGIAMRDGALAAILLGYEGDQATAFVVAFVERRHRARLFRMALHGI